MNSDYNEQYHIAAQGGSDTSEAVYGEDDYIPGEYRLATLIPFENYTMDVDGSAIWVEGAGYLSHFDWYLEKKSGDFLGSSVVDSDGVTRIDSGYVVGTGTRLLITKDVSRSVTAPDAPYQLRCRAQNKFGDIYYDIAYISVIQPEEEDE